jgi:cytochrome c-type biogenesis protein CcmE
MGGYGFYVWASFGVTALCMLVEPWLGHAAPSPCPAIGRRGPRLEGCCPMKPRHLRLAVAGGVLLAVGGIAALVLQRLPEQPGVLLLADPGGAKEAPLDRTFRIGGLVKEGSVQRDGRGRQLPRHRHAPSPSRALPGILPDLFKEGKGVVAQGKLDDGVFEPKEVLAKHDENYMPPEAADALEQAHQASR